MRCARISPVLLACLTVAACSGPDVRDVPVTTRTAAGTWTAPTAAEAAGRDNALVRVIEAIPARATLDLFAGGQKIFDNLEYKAVTPYREVPAARATFRLRPAGMDTAEPLAEATQQLRAGRHYTVVAMPGEDTRAASLQIFEDPMELPDEGQTRVRIVHASPDAGRLDVHVPGRGEPLVAGLDFQAVSKFTDMAAAATPLDIRPAERTESMLKIHDVNLSTDGVYTIVVIGRTRIEPPLETLVIEDRIPRR